MVGSLEDAERSCLEAIVREQNPLYYHTLASIYHLLGRPEHANEALQMAEALRVQPDDSPAG